MIKTNNGDLISISNAINAYQHIGIDIETIIEDTTGEYVGDFRDKNKLLAAIAKDQKRELMTIDAKMSSKTLEKIMIFDESVRNELYSQWPSIVGLTFEYIKANLENPNRNYKNFYEFLAEVKKQI